MLSVVPLWLVEFPPFQDLPQHLAAIRVLRSLDDPAFGLAPRFELALAATPHVAYHLAGSLVAAVLGVELGHRVLLSAVLLATPWALRSLIRAVGGDERVALLGVCLTYGVHLVLGFLPFVAGVPLCLLGLAWAVELADAPRWRPALGLGALLVLAFHVHVVPYSVAAAGVLLVALSPPGAGPTGARRGRRLATLLAALAPSAVLAALWLVGASSGRTVRGALDRAVESLGRSGPVEAPPASLAATFLDVFDGVADDGVLYAMVLVAWVGTLLAAAQARSGARRPRRWLALLCGASFALYLFLPHGHEWIWGIHARYAWLAALLVLPLVRFPAGVAGRLCVGAATLLAIVHLTVAGAQMRRFDAEEAAGLGGAIAAIPARERVVGLVYRPGSRFVRFAPLLHAAAWYQARKGGVAVFSFADYPSWPFRFREDDRPPRLRPRWEWEPEKVFVADELGWFRYVLVHGGPGPISMMPELFRPVHREGSWSVWRREGAADRAGVRSASPR